MKEIKNMQLPSFPLAEERVVERSNDRVSKPGGHYRNALAPMSYGLTHPSIASLADPLFACSEKRVKAAIVKKMEITTH